MPKTDIDEQPLTIAALYPELTKEQQEEAAYYIGRYLEVVQRIFERVNNLTESDGEPTMPME